MSNIPRAEYPRPQCYRPDWVCLNGEWEFEIDAGDSGFEREILKRNLTDKIQVPFCPESSLSGIEHVDFMNAVWYRREVNIPKDKSKKRVLLHFQAVDYDTTVWINSAEAGRHRGGFTPFTLDITQYVQFGETAVIMLRARDDNRNPQPRGKQSPVFHNQGCEYTRTTGIWQTVWLEFVPEHYLLRPRITPDLPNRRFRIEQSFNKNLPGGTVRAILKDNNDVIAESVTSSGMAFSAQLDLAVPADKLAHWSLENPYLYPIEIELIDSEGIIIDKVESYGGMRSVSFDDMAFCLNGTKLFQRLVLDQGYYPDGIMTAPSEQALIDDILLSKQAGFNGARLHQKVFEERFLYHADRLGYLIWVEFGDWGSSGFGAETDHQRKSATDITQWLEVLQRDYSHPSIIGWCPLNESYQIPSDKITTLDDATLGLFLAAKAMDTTRPVLDTSGYSHQVPFADVYDSHDYEQNPEILLQNQSGLSEGKPFLNLWAGKTLSIPYNGQPFFISEFGGIWWNPDIAENEVSWGYGERPKTIEEFYERFERLCRVLLDNPKMFGYCYTQLTDVFQEQNGIYKFDRSAKFDMNRIRQAQLRKAKIEE